MWRLFVFFILCVATARALTLSASTSRGTDTSNCVVVVDDETGAYTFSYSLVHGSANNYGASAQLFYSTDGGVSYSFLYTDHTKTISKSVSGKLSAPGLLMIAAHAWPASDNTDLTSDIKIASVGGKLVCEPRNLTTTGYLNSAIWGTASGSKNGAAYNLSILSGPGVAAINSANGEWNIIPTGVGSIQAKFWLSGAGIWSRSDDVVVTFTVQPESPKRPVTISLPANGGTSPTTYNVMQGGKSIGSFTQEAGAGAKIFQVGVDVNGGPVTMVQTTGGMMQDGVSLVQTSDGSGSVSKPNHLVDNPSNLTDDAKFVVGTDGTITDSSTGKVVDQTTPTKTPEKNTSPVVWSAGSGSQEDLVTNTVYREGIGKMVQAIEDQTKKILGEAEDTLTHENLGEFEQAPAQDAKVESVKGLVGRLPEAPEIDTSIETVSSVEMPIHFQLNGYSIDSDEPLNFARAGSAGVTVYRTTIAWLLRLGLFVGVVSLFRNAFAG